MNEFKTIFTNLKEIIAEQLHHDRKVLDKDVATTLNIKPATFSSYKRRDITPYRAILTYCHDNRIDVRKILFDKFEPIISYPQQPQAPIEDGKVRVRYFRTLDDYGRYLSL